MTSHAIDRASNTATPRSRQIFRANGVDLCAESFGDRSEPAVLLIMGASTSMDWWEDEFCERLASGGRFVVRYDHRDTGQSISYAPGDPRYALDDLLADAIGLLDCLAIATAHLVGMSMGGAIVQLAAVKHPDRVASLTLISTSPGGPSDSDLPSISEETLKRLAVKEPNWSDRAAVIDYLTYLARVSAGDARTFDEPSFRDLAGRVVDRTVDIEASITNHELIDVGARWRERLRELSAPTLVIHGTEDPVLPTATPLRWRPKSPAPSCSHSSGPATSSPGPSGTPSCQRSSTTQQAP
jgi:pimeloyl-ACP methyl ester carboxylesterase